MIQRTLTAILCLSCVLLGCKPQQDIKATGLVYCADATPQTLNPQLESSHHAIALSSRHLYDRLIEIDPISQQLLPGLATKWHSSEDRTEYWFELRKGVNFHRTRYFTPQRELNADDVVYSFNRILDPNHPYHYVGGGYPFFETINFGRNVRSITKLDSHLVKFELYRPDAAFVNSLASEFAVILSADYAQQRIDEQKTELFDTQPIGTGPFFYAAQQANHYIRYYRHNLYWKGKAKLEQLVFDITPTNSTRIGKLLSTQCDILPQPTTNQLDLIKQRDDLQVVRQAGFNVAYLAFNTQRAPFNTAENRRSFSRLIDKAQVNQSVFRETGQVANSILSPSSWAYRHNQLDLAPLNTLPRALSPFTQQALQFWVLDDPRSFNPQPERSAELIRANLERRGLKVNVRLVDWNVLRANLLNKTANYDILLAGWSSENSQPDDFFRLQFSCPSIKEGYNFSHWCHFNFDHLLDEAAQAPTLAQRLALYHKLQATLEREMPVLPLSHVLKMYAYNQSLAGISWNPHGGISFHHAYRK